MKITYVNVTALNKVFEDANAVRNRIPSVYARHIKRCIDGGLVTVSDDRRSLTLTDKGLRALIDRGYRREDWSIR